MAVCGIFSSSSLSNPMIFLKIRYKKRATGVTGEVQGKKLELETIQMTINNKMDK